MSSHAPPRLVYALARPPGAAGFALLVLGLLAAGTLLAWALQGAGPQPWPAALGALLWLLAGGAAWRCWQQWPVGDLEWEGGQWLWHVAEGPGPRFARLLDGAPQVCWDGQGFFLLCVTCAAGGRRWLWVHADSAPALWGDLRSTVYWRPKPARTA